jgi:hypothetical protein
MHAIMRILVLFLFSAGSHAGPLDALFDLSELLTWTYKACSQLCRTARLSKNEMAQLDERSARPSFQLSWPSRR